MIKEAIGTLVEGKSLTMEQAARVMENIMDGQTSPAQLAAFLTALRIKGEVADEIAGMATVMRDRAVPVKTAGPVLDIVGTGGDGLNTFNISTAAALVAAGAGIKVAKHGNRAASSRCGSADVLEKLGVKIDLNAAQVESCIREVGIGFMFAPVFHPAMKYAAGPRREMGIRTVFNILGPLTNPARAAYQVIGVPSPELGEKMVSALALMKAKHTIVVHGLNGMDEISLAGKSLVWEIKDRSLEVPQGPSGFLFASGPELLIRRWEVSPEDFGFSKAPLEAVTGGSPEDNAQIIHDILDGKTGPRRDITVINAAAALMAGGMAETLGQGVILAQETIDQGLAQAKLTHLIKFTQNISEE